MLQWWKGGGYSVCICMYVCMYVCIYVCIYSQIVRYWDGTLFGEFCYIKNNSSFQTFVDWNLTCPQVRWPLFGSVRSGNINCIYVFVCVYVCVGGWVCLRVGVCVSNNNIDIIILIRYHINWCVHYLQWCVKIHGLQI